MQPANNQVQLGTTPGRGTIPVPPIAWVARPSTRLDYRSLIGRYLAVVMVFSQVVLVCLLQCAGLLNQAGWYVPLAITAVAGLLLFFAPYPRRDRRSSGPPIWVVQIAPRARRRLAVLHVVYVCLYLGLGGMVQRDTGIVSPLSGIFYYVNAFNFLLTVLPAIIIATSESMVVTMVFYFGVSLLTAVLTDSRAVLMGYVVCASFLLCTMPSGFQRAYAAAVRFLTPRRIVGMAVAGAISMSAFALVAAQRNNVNPDAIYTTIMVSADRLAEGSTNRQVDEMLGLAGTEPTRNLDRIGLSLVPSFLTSGAKRSMKDGAEVMADQFGVGNLETQQVPLLVVNDLILRFGILPALVLMPLVLWASVMWLAGIGRLLGRLALPFLAAKLATFVKLYTLGLLGTVNYFTYEMLRDVIIVWIVVGICGGGRSFAKVVWHGYP